MLKREIFAKVLPANIPPDEYEVYKTEVERKNKALVEDAKTFVLPQQQINHCCRGPAEGLKPQQCYTDVPFRMEEYGDTKNTVATSGCGILIAKFLERTYGSELNLTIDELAKIAVEKGYCGYRKEADGSYTPIGMKHVFFERFIPSLYEFSSKRAESVQELIDALWDYTTPVLLLANNIYKNDEESKDSHFVVMLGFTPDQICLFDPEKELPVFVSPEKVFPALISAWVIKIIDW